MQNTRLGKCLFSLRIGVFIVMGMWTLDKFVNPDHTASIFERYYMIGGISEIMAYIMGTLQAALVIAFVIGFKKRFSYGLVFLLHAVSTISAYDKYLDPWTPPNLLFYAAFPMLIMIGVLYVMRNEDKYLSVS